MKVSLASVLTLNAGYVDTAGFLGLNGLFTAHVTGNFVTLGFALVNGTAGVLSKLLALPVFCMVALSARLLTSRFGDQHRPPLRALLAVEVALLIVGAAMAAWLSPFTDGDGWPALITGTTLVAAMALQNAAHRIYVPGAPPSTLMTGTTTQIMIDTADLMRGVAPDTAGAARARLKRLGAAVFIFALGCAAAAGLYAAFGDWCFLAAPLAGIAALFAPENNATAGSQH